MRLQHNHRLGRACTQERTVRKPISRSVVPRVFAVARPGGFERSVHAGTSHPNVREVGTSALHSTLAPLARADNEIGKVLYSQEYLGEVLERLGRQIGEDYIGKHTLVLGVLKGGFMFTADLIRFIHPVPPVMEIDFFKASSYGAGTETSGFVKLDDAFDLSSVKGKHVLVCEDIVDSGLTLSRVVALLQSAGPASIRVAALLDKRARRKVDFEADYVGIVCPDEFVVGYGIDYAERYRWLPYIGVPKPEYISSA